MDRLRVGIVGVGRWGSNIARVLWELEREGLVEFSVVVDLDLEKAKLIASRYGVERYSSSMDSLKNNVDAVVVAVPIPYLARTAMKLAEMGLNLFVEKPVATSTRELLELKKVAEENNVVVVPGFIMRFNPVVEYIAGRVKGLNVNVIELRRLSRRPPHARRNSILLDLAIHDIDIANYLFKDVEGKLVKWYYRRISGDELIKIVLEYDGVPVMIHVDGICPVKIREIDVIAEDVFIRGNTNRNQVLVKTTSGEELVELSGEEPLKKEIREWVKLVVQGKSNSPTIDDAFRALRVLEPILEAISGKQM